MSLHGYIDVLIPRGGAGLIRSVVENAATDPDPRVQEAVTVVRVHEPIPANTPFYLARYAEYKRLAEVMHEPWAALNRLG